MTASTSHLLHINDHSNRDLQRRKASVLSALDPNNKIDDDHTFMKNDGIQKTFFHTHTSATFDL